jgi:hypothetical protein
MFTIIFDTYGGLCNQMYDIHSAVNFCATYNIPFSFRYASFRSNNNLCTWFDVLFDDIFNDQFLSNIDLYKPYNTLNCNLDNTYNYDNKARAIEWINAENPIIPQLECVNKSYIVLKQFWAIDCIIKERCVIKEIYPIYPNIEPCFKLLSIFKRIADAILPEKYNYIHYRYEDDFNNHFKITNPLKICDIIEHVQFKNNTLPVYIAASNITNLPHNLLHYPIDQIENIIYKPADFTYNLNFEEAAFIDYMIGKHANEVYGHNNSSFSALLNSLHVTNNYYNLEM